MYKYRPAFSNNPKVHYHATAEQVSEPGRICSQITPDNMELGINSPPGSSECQSVEVNNNTWHCCAIVYIFTLLLMKTCLLSQLSSVELDRSVLLTGMRCCFSVSRPDPEVPRSVTSHRLLLTQVPTPIHLRGSWTCLALFWIRPFNQ